MKTGESNVGVLGRAVEATPQQVNRQIVGAKIVEPIAASAWSSGLGMLTDRFGVTWILDVAAALPDA